MANRSYATRARRGRFLSLPALPTLQPRLPRRNKPRAVCGWPSQILAALDARHQNQWPSPTRRSNPLSSGQQTSPAGSLFGIDKNNAHRPLLSRRSASRRADRGGGRPQDERSGLGVIAKSRSRAVKITCLSRPIKLVSSQPSGRSLMGFFASETSQKISPESRCLARCSL